MKLQQTESHSKGLKRLAGVPAPEISDSDSIGDRLRRRRKAKRLTLRQVAEATGLAEGFISQLERGIHSGSVRTLQKICEVLGLPVGDLFLETWAEAPAVRRFTDNHGFSFGENARKMRLTPRTFDHLEIFVGFLEPGGSTGIEPYAHGDSEELVLVISGTVDVTIGNDVHRLEAMDSIPYSSRLAHRVLEVAGKPARVLWAIAPPSY